jgi:hypothetical protein
MCRFGWEVGSFVTSKRGWKISTLAKPSKKEERGRVEEMRGRGKGIGRVYF